MPRFQDYAIARFVVCCNEHVAPAVPNGLQNAILRRERLNDVRSTGGHELATSC